MYGKIFEQLYTSTLALRGPWEAMALWPHMIGLADQHGEVDMPAGIISRKTLLPQEIVDVGLAALAEPDPSSRGHDHEGRRIVLIDPDRSWGWRLVNYQRYSKLRSDDERREYFKNYRREQRLAEKSNSSQTPVNNVEQFTPVQPVTHTDTDTNTKKHTVRKKTPHGEWFAKFWETWPKGPHKVGKKPCAEKWARENLDDIAKQIVDRVEIMRRTKQWTREDGQFAPMPITWLNQRRWEDGALTDLTSEKVY